MPASAIRHVSVDHVVAAADLAPLLTRLVGEPAPVEDRVMTEHDRAPDRAERGLHALEENRYPGSPSAFTCPECGGALWELTSGTNGNLTRFACHVGHSYSPDTLATGMAATLEAALWTALRALEENGAFLRRMEKRATINGLDRIAEGYATKANDVEARAEIVRSALVDDVSRAARIQTPAAPPPQQPS
jgi:two-component system chemotaxis response regulator CheB